MNRPQQLVPQRKFDV